ncbi:MAG: hypothetical protein CMI78_01760 [Candidatus Pelagibacter sp.]|nr:hypothetical protein [Candidatus Pelagibacter sp.]OUW67906.1 MAG: hypothetical protein CBD62_02735 [Candidatus Pelagibacter sp. TMED202]
MLSAPKRKLFIILSFFMGLVIICSNYLVQFPVKFYELDNLLTYGAFSYPITFLITDLANRAFGKKIARRLVLIGFFIGIILTLFVSTNFEDIISIRIAIGSATAFIIAQNLDVSIFDLFRKKTWYVAPLTSSILGSIIDTFLFFSIAFYNTGIPWFSLALGDLAVKLIVALIMLIPFRLLINKIKDFTDLKIKNLNY